MTIERELELNKLAEKLARTADHPLSVLQDNGFNVGPPIFGGHVEPWIRRVSFGEGSGKRVMRVTVSADGYRSF